MKTEKPNVDDFIRGAKAEKAATQSAPAAVAAEPKKDKTFLLRIPYDLWDRARRKAGAEAISLHDYIIMALQEKVER